MLHETRVGIAPFWYAARPVHGGGDAITSARELCEDARDGGGVLMTGGAEALRQGHDERLVQARERALPGAAPLPPDVMSWYRRLGLELLEGYGMTEQFAFATTSMPGFSASSTLAAKSAFQR